MEQRLEVQLRGHAPKRGMISQTLEQHDLTRVMVSMELEIDDIRVAEEGLDVKNSMPTSSGRARSTGLTTNSKDVWSRGSESWTRRPGHRPRRRHVRGRRE